MERAERLLDLVALFLNAREAISWAEIQESFSDDYARGSAEANIRKFERDKADLAELGLTLTYVQGEERDKDGYVLDRGAYYLPELALGPDELAVLYAAGAAALAEPAFPFREDLAHALKKMAFAAGDEPGAGRDWSRVVMPRARAIPAGVTGAAGEPAAGSLYGAIDQLSRAVASRKFVEFDYRAQASGERTRRRVDPYGLVYRFGAWILVGHCHLRKDLRSFRVDRVHGLTVNAARPRSADFEVPGSFKVSDHAAAHPWEFRRHAPIEVTLRLRPDMAFLADRTFAGARRVSTDARGVVLALTVRDQDALVRALLPLGPAAELLSPPPLRTRLRDLLRDLLERHGAAMADRKKAG